MPCDCSPKIVANACIMANGTVRIRFINSNLRFPFSPDLAHLVSVGTTSVDNSWTMIEAVI